MKLLTFRAGGAPRVGALRPGATDEVVEVVEVREFSDMLALIDAGAEGLARAAKAMEDARSPRHRLKDLDLAAPLPAPRGNVIAIGRN